MQYASLPDKSNLYEIPLFANLSAGEIARLHGVMRYVVFKKRETILAQGQNSRSVFFLRKGLAKVCNVAPQLESEAHSRPRPVVINVVVRGSVLGEINAIDEQGHTASVLAIHNCACFMMESESFRFFRAQIPKFAANLDRHLALLIRHQTTRYCRFLELDLTGRIAALLLDFAARFGETDAQGQRTINVPLTQTLLSDMTGHSRENVSRKLNFFSRQGWICTPRDHRITILNAAALTKYCPYSL